jgi:hypothetical protein
MGKTSFQNLQKLVQEIDAKIAKLKSGNLLVSELEDLVKLSADLHERMAVLRHKAYEKHGEPAEKIIVPETKTEEIPAFDISFTPEPVNTTPEIKAELPVEEPETSIDFSIPVIEPETTAKKVIPVAEPEVKKPIHVIREEVKPDSSSLHEKFLKEDVDLNDTLKKEEEDLPLRKKLGLKPIKDLRSEIGIGKKFEYINLMFAGDNKAYETAIDELNNCADQEAARKKLNVFASVYRWNLEEKTIVKFVELVERRFI